MLIDTGLIMMSNNENNVLESNQEVLDKKSSETAEIRSLKDLIDRVSGKDIPPFEHEIDSGSCRSNCFSFPGNCWSV